MKNIKYALLTAALLASGTLAAAHDSHDDGYAQDGRYRQEYRDDDDDRYSNAYGNRYDRHDDNRGGRYAAQYGRYDNARVVRVDRLGGYGRDYSRQCYNSRSTINNGAVIGAIAGGALGNQVGNGDGRGASTVAGALIGGLIGQSVDRDNRGGLDRHYVECRREVGYDRGRNAEYRVTYQYRGRIYSTIMPYHPGNVVRVRIDIRPQYDRRVAYRY